MWLWLWLCLLFLPYLFSFVSFFYDDIILTHFCLFILFCCYWFIECFAILFLFNLYKLVLFPCTLYAFYWVFNLKTKRIFIPFPLQQMIIMINITNYKIKVNNNDNKFVLNISFCLLFIYFVFFSLLNIA